MLSKMMTDFNEYCIRIMLASLPNLKNCCLYPCENVAKMYKSLMYEHEKNLTFSSVSNIKTSSYIALYPVHMTTQVLYTSPLGRPVPANTNSTFLESIQLCCNYCTKCNHMHISTAVCNQILICTAE